MASVPRAFIEDDVDEELYPSSDGKPVAETDRHLAALLALVSMLQHHYRRDANVYVTGNIFWYWEEGNPKARRSPDVMVVHGVPKGLRRSYRSWEEGGIAPAVIFELTSRRTWREDAVVKKELYARLGVGEYYLFDPYGKLLDSRLIGYQLREGRYVALKPRRSGRLVSPRLGLELEASDSIVRLYDAKTQVPLLTAEEKDEALAEKDDVIAEKDARIAELEGLLRERGSR